MNDDLLIRQTFPVQGMTCAGCAGHVEKALRGVDGVRYARVNLAMEQATVEFDPEACAPEKLSDAVKAAGYALEVPVDEVAVSRPA